MENVKINNKNAFTIYISQINEPQIFNSCQLNNVKMSCISFRCVVSFMLDKCLALCFLAFVSMDCNGSVFPYAVIISSWTFVQPLSLMIISFFFFSSLLSYTILNELSVNGNQYVHCIVTVICLHTVCALNSHRSKRPFE